MGSPDNLGWNLPQESNDPPSISAELDETNLPSRNGEVFLDSIAEATLPYDLTISDWSEPKIEKLKDIGYQKTSIVTLEDGSVYVFRDTIPDILLWDTKVDFTMPLSTRVNGFNSYIARKLAKRGIASRMVGTNQSRGFSLLHDAQATLHILNEDDRAQAESAKSKGHNVDHKLGQSVMIGYSMGEMKLLVELGLAPKMNREIPVSIGLDPCLANKVDYIKELENLPGLLAYLGREVLELPHNTVRTFIEDRNPVRTLKRLGHFMSTIGVTPEYLLNTTDKWNVIATGETGDHLDGIPEDDVVIVHFFDKSHFNDNAKYKEKLSKLPYFRAIHEPGYHLSGSNPSVINRTVDKVVWALALMSEGVHGHDLANELTQKILRKN